VFSNIRIWVQPVALILILIVVLPLSALSASPNQFSGYELRQFHKDRGEIILDVCPHGIKAVTKKSNLITICMAPDWKVVSFSPRTKKIFSTDISHYSGEDRVVFAISGNPQFDSFPFKKAGVANICGLPVEQYESTHEFSASQFISYHHHEATGDFPAEVHYSTSSKLAMQPQFTTFIARFYKFPKTDGLAVELLYDSIAYRKCSLLITHTCQSKTFTNDDFKQPTDYKKVKTLAEVQADITNQQEAETLIESFDTREPLHNRH
jgi:hypothetical protein